MPRTRNHKCARAPLSHDGPWGQFNRIIENLFENLFEILVLENIIGKYFLVLKSQKDFQ